MVNEAEIKVLALRTAKELASLLADVPSDCKIVRFEQNTFLNCDPPHDLITVKFDFGKYHNLQVSYERPHMKESK